MLTSETLRQAGFAEQFPFQFWGFASDLEVTRTSTPTKIPTNMGNGMDFLLIKRTCHLAVYRQANGCLELDVFND
jgi:hypothetical protein